PALRPRLRLRPRQLFAFAGLALALAFAVLASPAAFAQPPGGAPGGDAKGGPTPAKPDTAAPVITHHQITVNGAALAYTVTTGKLPLKNDQGETEAEIF